MSLLLDASALLGAVIDGRHRGLVIEAIAAAQDDGGEQVFASAVALTEALAAIDRLADDEIVRSDLEDAVRRLWDHVHVIPVDQRCLDDAARLTRERPIRLSDGIHLAAALRLPPPRRLVTIDPVQVPAAIGLGFDVVSP